MAYDMNTEEIYLRLLRAACFGVAQDVCVEPTELNAVLRLCQLHGTGPLVYNELLKAPGCLTPQLSMQMKQVCMQNMMLQGQWEQMIARCFGALHDGGVRAVLMKGFSYARLYPMPYLRSWGDLDVWVGPEQYHKACGILREAFPEAKHHDEEWDELKHYCFVFPNGMAIELHRVSMDFLSARDQAYWCRLEAEASQLTYAVSQLTNEQLTCPADEQRGEYFIEVGGVRVPVFEPKYDLLFCFMHSWEHFCGTGIPLKQVCDMALLIHYARGLMDDWSGVEKYLEMHLTRLRMLDVWRSYGYLACRAMGLPPESWPLGVDSKYGERLYRQVMAEGQCRKKDYGEAADRYEARDKARRMNILARKWLTLTQRFEKARFMYRFAPRYARYILVEEIKKGIRRTIHGAEMINY